MYHISFSFCRIETRRTFQVCVIVIVHLFNVDHYITGCSIRRKKRSTCCLWTTWSWETWRRASCPVNTFLPSSTLNRGVDAKSKTNICMLCMYLLMFCQYVTGTCIKTCVKLSLHATRRRTWTAGRRRSSELVFTQRKTRYTREHSPVDNHRL